LALTIFGAKLLLQSPKFKENCVTVNNDVSEFISNGKSVFCKHVVNCGNNVRVGSDVAVLDQDGNVIAVGKAVLSTKMIREFKRGVAVKVRESLKAGR
ncbi:MAG: PUA domain-containing protein, partial [Nitrososphaerales archaeon]